MKICDSSRAAPMHRPITAGRITMCPRFGKGRKLRADCRVVVIRTNAISDKRSAQN